LSRTPFKRGSPSRFDGIYVRPYVTEVTGEDETKEIIEDDNSHAIRPMSPIHVPDHRIHPANFLEPSANVFTHTREGNTEEGDETLRSDVVSFEVENADELT
jgi:phosphoribosyl 1,2-cyclic phosphodiesterase